MSCSEFEKLIALDVEGDLGVAEAARVRGHLETCGACRELTLGLRESQAALKALSSGVLDEQALAAWRRGVLARIDAVPPRGLRWQWALAAAVVLLALLAARALVRQMPHSPAPVVARLTPPPAVLAPPPPAALTRPSPDSLRPRVRRARTRQAPPAGPLLVKLETADPNVVIYWIVEGKGD